MSDLTLDLAGAGTIRPINTMMPTNLGVTDDERVELALEPDDGRWAVGQHLQCIGPLPGAKIRKEGPPLVKVLAVLGTGYRVSRYKGDCGDFIHTHAHRMWIPISAEQAAAVEARS